MGTAWQFWPGHDRNFVNPGRDHYEKVVAEKQAEEVRLTAHEEELKVVGHELEAKHGLKFLGTNRQYEPGISVPKDPRLSWTVPPKRIISLGFEVAPAGTAGWRVRERLAEWVRLSGQNSRGWNVWLEEKDLAKLSEIWRKPDLPPVEERFVPQKDGTLANFGGRVRESGYSDNVAYYVVTADGSLRNPDVTTKSEKLWKVVAKDEVALCHGKSFQHAEHVFEVRHLPKDGLTEAQKATVNLLQEQIAGKWEGRITGNGNLSPSMGGGWGLTAPTYRQITRSGANGQPGGENNTAMADSLRKAGLIE